MKKLFYLIPALLLAGILFYACQENINEPPNSENVSLFALGDDPDIYPLYAGQNILVGEVQVWNDENLENLFVKFVITDPDWCLEETHLAVAITLDGIPQTNKGNPIPGQFPYKHEELGCVAEDPYTIPLPAGSVCGDLLVVATHAVVKNLSCEQTGIVYGMHRITGDVYAIDVVSGTASLEFSSTIPPGTNVSPNGLAYDGVNQRMYYANYRTGANPRTLYFYDYTTATESVAGEINAENAAADFSNGKYYYIDSYPATDDLYEVTLNVNGTIFTNYKLGDISGDTHKWEFSGDIAVKDGIVYGWGKCTTDNEYEFFTYDLGSSTFNYTTTAYQAFSMQLAFGSDGTLYGHKSNASGNAYFYEIDITNGSLSNETLINPDLAYTDCASGMICEPNTETAWGGTTPFPGRNWATYFTYEVTCAPSPPPTGCETETAWGGNSEGEGSAWWYYFDTQGLATQTIYAGQNATDGTVTWDGANLVIDLGSWVLQADDEAVKIEGYEVIPLVRPPTGQFTLYKGTDLTVTGDGSRYYAIHLDVQLCE